MRPSPTPMLSPRTESASGQLSPCRARYGLTSSAKRHFTIEIPRGIEEGMVLRVQGHGLASPHVGGPPGDVYILGERGNTIGWHLVGRGCAAGTQ